MPSSRSSTNSAAIAASAALRASAASGAAAAAAGVSAPRRRAASSGEPELVQIYACLCDRTRLRMLHLLARGPLCVCHFQTLLDEPQVKISKHLAYLRARGLVESRRRGSWIVYQFPEPVPPKLAANLACLQDCVREDPVFRRDLARLEAQAKRLAAMGPDGLTCCG